METGSEMEDPTATEKAMENRTAELFWLGGRSAGGTVMASHSLELVLKLEFSVAIYIS